MSRSPSPREPSGEELRPPGSRPTSATPEFVVEAFTQCRTISKFKSLQANKVAAKAAAKAAAQAAKEQAEKEALAKELDDFELPQEDVASKLRNGTSELSLSEEDIQRARLLLMDVPIFANCSQQLLESIAAFSPRVALQDTRALPLKDNGELYVVEQGSVQVCVGMGPATTAGPGSYFNSVGMLGLHRECQSFMPSAQKQQSLSLHSPSMELASPYELVGYSGVAPRIFEGTGIGIETRCSSAAEEHNHGFDKDQLAILRPDVRCMYNLCPHSCSSGSGGRQGTAASSVSGKLSVHSPGRKNQDGLLPFSVVGMEDANGMPAQIIRVQLSFFDELRNHHSTTTDDDAAMRKSIDVFRQTCKGIESRMQSLLTHCSQDIFPAVPLDVMWSIAEIGRSTVEEAGHDLVKEGDHDGEMDGIVIIDNGVATVEKVMGSTASQQTITIGRIRTGAIIGDICYLGAAFPRAATVRTKTRVEALILPAEGLINIFSRFPGIIETSEQSIMPAIEFMQTQLPSRTDTLAGFKLFARCKPNFLGTIGVASNRQIYYCGQVIVEERSDQAMLYIVEYGCCSVEKDGEGHVATLTMGCCFGEQTLLGFSRTANATIRARSPYVLIMAVPEEALKNALDRYQGESDCKHVQALMKEPPDDQQRGGQVQHIELFRSCSDQFCDYLSSTVRFVCFMPGQTVVVQGNADEPNMYAVVGGVVAVERSEKHVTNLHAGATFGELVMLELAPTRSCTIRARTFSILIEIPRSGFLDALRKYPADMVHFQDLNDRKEVVPWPCLKSAPERLQYLLDLYAETRTSHDGNDQWAVEAASVLVVEGELTIVNEEGDRLETFVSGQCRDYHHMLDLPDGNPITLMKPGLNCKVKLVTKEVWDKVLAEFPDEKDKCQSLIREYTVQCAQEKLGFDPGSSQSLTLSPIFRALSEELMQQLAGSLVSRLCTPGSEIIRPEQHEHGMYILLSGHVTAQDVRGEPLSEVGRIFGETVLLGISKEYAYTVETLNLCTVQFLSKKVFDEVIMTSEDDNRIVSFLTRESRDHGSNKEKLVTSLGQCKSFRDSHIGFVRMLADELEAVFYAPSDVIFKYGEECIFGQSPCYLLLAGQVNVESKLGVRLGSVRAVELFGEAAVPGTMGSRSATVIAWEVGLVFCARIPGKAMAKAFAEFPRQSEKLIELFQSRQDANAEIESNRKLWLKDTALPALMGQPIFQMCAPQFLWALATPLHESCYERGKTLVHVGDEANSMFIILKGDVALESRSGARISVITPGASVGAVAMLGLLPTRTATLRALSQQVSILEVTSLTLQHALSTKSAGRAGERFKQYVRARQEQVSQGMPLRCLNIDTAPEDVSVSAVGLHAQRVCFKSGHIWHPLPDDSPDGPRMSIIANGRALLETPEANGRPRRKVMSLVPGSIIIEGIAAEFGASMRSVTTPCEVYQIFMNDFKIATSTVSGATPWIWRFKLLEKEARREMKERLENMHGLVEGLAPHPSDEGIHVWRNRRDQNIRLAQERHAARAEAVDDTKLPSMVSITSKASESRDSTSMPHMSKMGSPLTKAKSQHHISFGTGLSAYPCLPLLQEPSFSKKERSLQRNSKSESSLQRIHD